MITTFNSEKENLYFVGDIHKLTNIVDTISTIPDNSSIIILGDIEIGFSYYDNIYDILKYINEYCQEHNLNMYCIRGNHDNPKWFIKPLKPLNKNYPNNIYFVPDYTVIKHKKEQILCIGGAISLDRSNRIEYNNYWKDECPNYNAKNTDSLANNFNITILASHDMPYQIFNSSDWSSDLLGYKSIDKTLQSDVSASRIIIGSILQNIINAKHSIQYCFYGHYHRNKTEYMSIEGTCNAITFRGLNIKEIVYFK